jgi:hypothetical protein
MVRMRLMANLIALCALTAACGSEDAPNDASTPDAGAGSPVGSTARDASLPNDATVRRDASSGSTQNSTPRVVDAGIQSDDPRFANLKPTPSCANAPELDQVYKHSASVGPLGVVGDKLYFAGADDGVWAMFKDGSAAPEQVWEGYAPTLAVAGETIYVRTNIGGFSLTPEQLAAGDEEGEAEVASSVHGFGDHVYSWEGTACYSEERAVLSYDAKGEYDLHSMPCPVGGMVGMGDAIFATHAGISDSADDGVYAYTFGSEDDPKRIVEEPGAKALTMTATHLYFTKALDDDDTRVLMRAPIAGGSAEAVAGPFSWRGAASDGKNTYVADSRSACLYRIDDAANALVPIAKLPVQSVVGTYAAPYLYLGSSDGALTRVKL